MVVEAVRSGINKVNYDTELKQANTKAMKKILSENPEVYDIRKIFKPCMEAMKNVVKEKIMVAYGHHNFYKVNYFSQLKTICKI